MGSRATPAFRASSASIQDISSSLYFILSINYEKTVIYYQPGKLGEALQIASELPVEARLKKADIKHRNVKMRIIMGRDFLNYKAAMELLVDKSA